MKVKLWIYSVLTIAAMFVLVVLYKRYCETTMFIITWKILVVIFMLCMIRVVYGVVIPSEED